MMKRECIRLKVRTYKRTRLHHSVNVGHPWPSLWNPAQLSCRDHTSVHHPQFPICIYVKSKQEPKTIRIPSGVFQDFPPFLQTNFLARAAFWQFFSGDLPFWGFSKHHRMPQRFCSQVSVVHTKTTTTTAGAKDRNRHRCSRHRASACGRNRSVGSAGREPEALSHSCVLLANRLNGSWSRALFLDVLEMLSL